MPRINPLRLRHYRAKQNLSQEDLAGQSGIDKGTIFRIEAAKTKRNGARVVEALAKALKVEAAQLTAPDTEGIDAPTEEFLPKTQLNMRVTAEVRNALALVSLRYGVKPTEVIEFAPFLFHLAASESLKDRATRLADLQSARAGVEAFSGRFKHITERLVSDWDAENLEGMEARSIATRDLRGDHLDDGDSLTDSRPLDYDDDETNPFVVHLRERLEAVQPDATTGWKVGIPMRASATKSAVNRPLNGLGATKVRQMILSPGATASATCLVKSARLSLQSGSPGRSTNARR